MSNNYMVIGEKKIVLNDEEAEDAIRKFGNPNFSDFIAVFNGTIAIKGEKPLESHPGTQSIVYSDVNRWFYDKPSPEYEEVAVEDLEYGDVVCVHRLIKAKRRRLTPSDFGIFVGIEERGAPIGVFQYLWNYCGLERVGYLNMFKSERVVRFKRDE